MGALILVFGVESAASWGLRLGPGGSAEPFGRVGGLR